MNKNDTIHRTADVLVPRGGLADKTLAWYVGRKDAVVFVTVAVKLTPIINELGRRAAEQKRGVATAMGGNIKVKILRGRG